MFEILTDVDILETQDIEKNGFQKNYLCLK